MCGSRGTGPGPTVGGTGCPARGYRRDRGMSIRKDTGSRAAGAMSGSLADGCASARAMRMRAATGDTTAVAITGCTADGSGIGPDTSGRTADGPAGAAGSTGCPVDGAPPRTGDTRPRTGSTRPHTGRRNRACAITAGTNPILASAGIADTADASLIPPDPPLITPDIRHDSRQSPDPISAYFGAVRIRRVPSRTATKAADIGIGQNLDCNNRDLL